VRSGGEGTVDSSFVVVCGLLLVCVREGGRGLFWRERHAFFDFISLLEEERGGASYGLVRFSLAHSYLVTSFTLRGLRFFNATPEGIPLSEEPLAVHAEKQ